MFINVYRYCADDFWKLCGLSLAVHLLYLFQEHFLFSLTFNSVAGVNIFFVKPSNLHYKVPSLNMIVSFPLPS